MLCQPWVQLHPLAPAPRASEFLLIPPLLCPQHVPPACPRQSHTGQGFDKCFLSHTLLIRKMTPGNCPVGNCRSHSSMGTEDHRVGTQGTCPPCPTLLGHLVCSPLLGSDVLWGQ